MKKNYPFKFLVAMDLVDMMRIMRLKVMIILLGMLDGQKKEILNVFLKSIEDGEVSFQKLIAETIPFKNFNDNYDNMV